MIGKIIRICLLVVLIAGIAYSVNFLIHMYSDTYEIKGTVVKTWIDPTDGGSAYLLKIRLSDGTMKMLEVKKNGYCFNDVNEDILFSDIEVNKTYAFKCWGWDITSWWVFPLYWYPNVIDVTSIG